MQVTPQKSILLADDDVDDCMLFEDALKQISTKVKLTTAKDGQELMQILHDTVPPSPEVIFLDLNMPCKNGFECLNEIKQSPKLKNIPIVIFSTTTQKEAINRVYNSGANLYICKPGSFITLKKAISQILAIDWHENFAQPSIDKFVLQPQ